MPREKRRGLRGGLSPPTMAGGERRINRVQLEQTAKPKLSATALTEPVKTKKHSGSTPVTHLEQADQQTSSSFHHGRTGASLTPSWAPAGTGLVRLDRSRDRLKPLGGIPLGGGMPLGGMLGAGGGSQTERARRSRSRPSALTGGPTGVVHAAASPYVCLSADLDPKSHPEDFLEAVQDANHNLELSDFIGTFQAERHDFRSAASFIDLKFQALMQKNEQGHELEALNKKFQQQQQAGEAQHRPEEEEEEEEEAAGPDAYTAGVTCVLFNELLQHLPASHKGSVLNMWGLLYGCIYPPKKDVADDDVADDDEEDNFFDGSQKEVRKARVIRRKAPISTTPYFKLYTDSIRRIDELEKDLTHSRRSAAKVQAQKEALKQASQRSVMVWSGRFSQLVFSGWKRYAELCIRAKRKAQRILEAFVRETSPGVILMEWYRYTQDERARRQLDAQVELKGDVEEDDTGSPTAGATAPEVAAETKAEIDELRQQLKDEKEQSRLIEHQLQSVRAKSEQTVAGVHDLLNEVKAWRSFGKDVVSSNIEMSRRNFNDMGLCQHNMLKLLSGHDAKLMNHKIKKVEGIDMREERSRISLELAKNFKPNDFLFEWINYHLHTIDEPHITNFGADLRDGKVLLKLFHKFNPTFCPSGGDLAKLEEMTVYDRCDVCVKEAAELAVHLFSRDGHQVRHTKFEFKSITQENLLTENIAANTQFLCQLMICCCGMTMPEDHHALVKLERVVGELTETALKIEKVLEGDEQDEVIAHGEMFSLIDLLRTQGQEVRDGISYADFELQSAESDFSMCNEQLVNEIMRIHEHITGLNELSHQSTHMEGDTEVIELAHAADEDWYKLRPEHILDLWPALHLEDDKGQGEVERHKMLAVQAILMGHVKALQACFRQYASGDAQLQAGFGETLSPAEFASFIGDLQVVSPGFTTEDIQDIVKKVKMKDPGETESDEIAPVQFVEAVVRIADQFLNSPGETSEQLTTTIADRLQNLFANHVSVHTVQVNADDFRQQLCVPEVIAVVRKHTPRLRKVFNHFAAQDHTDKDKNHTHTINNHEFIKMAENAKLMDSFLTKAKLGEVFDSMQSDIDKGMQTSKEEMEGTAAKSLGVGDHRELTFNEFIECFAAVAVLKHPEPYQPLHFRLERFITKHFDLLGLAMY